ncbi:MAG: ATP-binding protein [Bacteroidia bacterium]|nr:ATP-binding protein [Bacteroidia bacterium]
MNVHKPEKLIIYSGIVFSLLFCIIFFSSAYLSGIHVNWLIMLLTAVLIWIISTLILSFIQKKFIYEKIKVIYKTIHNSKTENGRSIVKPMTGENALENINKEVAEWAERHNEEIRQLKKLETYRREFLANVSHELKTPLFNIQGYILTLLDGALDDKNVNRDYLQKSEKNIDRLINIVEDLEIISQFESGEMNLFYSRFDIVSLCHEVFDMLENKARKKKIRFSFTEDTRPDKPVFVFADKERIQQALINLADNSLKYGVEGGQTRVGFHDMDENILIEISDNGIGIGQEHLPRLFERFYRVDKSRSRDAGGSGLGLAIVKHIIESHKQTIHVRSSPGIGSSFSFTLKKG